MRSFASVTSFEAILTDLGASLPSYKLLNQMTRWTLTLMGISESRSIGSGVRRRTARGLVQERICPFANASGSDIHTKLNPE